jgi:hypothetical protein
MFELLVEKFFGVKAKRLVGFRFDLLRYID